MSKRNSIYSDNISVRYRGLDARLLQLGNGEAAIQFTRDGPQTIILTHDDLKSEMQYGHLLFPSEKVKTPGSVKLTPAAILEKHRIDTYVRINREMVGPNSAKGVGGLQTRRKAIAKAAEILNDKNPISPSTLAELCKNENEQTLGAAYKIITKPVRARKPTLPECVTLCVLSVIDEEILLKLPKNLSITHILNVVKEKIKKLNQPELKAPSRTWLSKFLKKLVWELHPKSGLKATEFKKLLRNAHRKFKTEYPLHRVESDGVFLQVGIVDDDGNYLGAVTAIFIIDVHTRGILGYSARVGKGEDSSSVIHAIRHALCEKKEGTFSTINGNTWPFHGVFSQWVADGGSAFISVPTISYLTMTCGTVVETVPVAAGWLKPFIERFNLTLRLNFASQLPGYVGPMDDQKQLEYSLKENAVLTFPEFKHYLECWIVDEYHHTPHSGLGGKTPYEAWELEIENKWEPERPYHEENVELPYGEQRVAKVSGDAFHLGVTINSLRYNDEDGRLQDIARHLQGLGHPPRVNCEFSKNDVSKISVLDPRTDEYFIVSSVDSDIREGTTYEELKIKQKIKKSLMSRDKPMVLANDKNLANKKSELAAKNEGKKRRRQRDAIPEDLADAINKQSESNSYTPPKSFSSQSLSDLSSPLDDIDEDDDGIFESD